MITIDNQTQQLIVEKSLDNLMLRYYINRSVLDIIRITASNIDYDENIEGLYLIIKNDIWC